MITWVMLVISLSFVQLSEWWQSPEGIRVWQTFARSWVTLPRTSWSLSRETFVSSLAEQQCRSFAESFTTLLKMHRLVELLSVRLRCQWAVVGFWSEVVLVCMSVTVIVQYTFRGVRFFELA